MKTFLLSLFFVSLNSFAGWENPAVLCPEEILPAGLPCPDLSTVKNLYTDFPTSMSDFERREWLNQKASDLKLCRNQEVLKRESLRPGSFTPLQIQLGWMIVDGGKNVPEKLQAIHAATQKYSIPPQVLIGALTQESLLASLGISPDGGNYSCGIAQLNIQEWCSSISVLTAAERDRMGWPAISCGLLPTDIVEPFYAIASTRLGNRPEYQISAQDFANITYDQVVNSFPAGSENDQLNRFKAITSFLKNCQNISLSIAFKAKTLNQLFSQFVPSPLRTAETYARGQTFIRSCANPYPSRYYPLHTGWLLAVAQYNAGPRQAQIVEHYYQVRDNKFPNLNPLDLIEALHWGGQIKEGTNRLYFVGQNQTVMNQLWYKSCVAQRHVARVIQHVTIPGNTIARSLEQVACAHGAVPKYRRISSGIKNPL